MSVVPAERRIGVVTVLAPALFGSEVLRVGGAFLRFWGRLTLANLVQVARASATCSTP